LNKTRANFENVHFYEKWVEFKGKRGLVNRLNEKGLETNGMISESIECKGQFNLKKGNAMGQEQVKKNIMGEHRP